MSAIRRSTSPTTDPLGSAPPIRNPLRGSRRILILAALPFLAGCAPEVLVPAFIALPVLYANMARGGPANVQRPAPPLVWPSQNITSTVRANPLAIEQPSPQTKPSVQSIPRETVNNNQSTTRQIPGAPAPTRVVRSTPPLEILPPRRAEPSPNRPPTAASAIMEGAQAYNEMRWDDATGVLNRALGSGTCTNPQRNQAHILLGAIEYQQGNPKAAKAHFVTAYQYDRSTSPSSQLFPPQLIEFYREVNNIKDHK